MTAIGFFMLLAGGLIFDFARATDDDAFLMGGVLTSAVGAVLFVSGVAAWLWRVMP